jgi:hypothetical protein
MRSMDVARDGEWDLAEHVVSAEGLRAYRTAGLVTNPA